MGGHDPCAFEAYARHIMVSFAIAFALAYSIPKVLLRKEPNLAHCFLEALFGGTTHAVTVSFMICKHIL